MAERDPNGVGKYANNSHKARDRGEDEPPAPRVKVIASGRRRKKSLGRKFRDAFGGGDAREAGHSAIRDMLIPEGKALVVDAVIRMLETAILGESRGRSRGFRGSPRGGHTDYGSRFRGGREERRPTTQNRNSYDIGEVIVDSRVHADEILDTLFGLVDEYEAATVADLFQMADIETNPIDRRWGWEDMRGARAQRLPNGTYLVDVPRPVPLD